MCLRSNKRKPSAAGAPNRPGLGLVGCRLASASYPAATICSSASTRSACSIQSSRRSLTSSAINPSPKPSCARRISITPSSRAPSTRLRTQQIMIEFANGLDRLLQLLIVVQPAANLADALATHAELPRASTSIGDRQNKHPVSFATRAFRAVFGMSDVAFQHRATQQFAADRQLADKLLARSKGSISNHS